MSLTRYGEDITHIHYPPRFFPEVTAVSRILSRRRAPLVLTCHLLFNESLVSMANAIARLHDRIVVKRVFRSADKIIALSDSYKELLEKSFNIDPDKIAVIPPGIDEDFPVLRHEPEDMRNRYRIPGNRVVVCVGRLSPEKGLDYLLRAFRTVVDRLPDASLLIVGDGPLTNQLEYLSRELRLESHIKFAGRLSHEEISSVLAIADVVVLPSIIEGLPIVLLEAMAMGKPVVASRVGGIPEVVVDGESGILVAARNVRELTDALLSILTDRKVARQMGYKGREIVQADYAWGVVTQKVLAVYKELVNGTNRM
jgi:glycosyltransferase involved in cell wall biosynthesis